MDPKIALLLWMIGGKKFKNYAGSLDAQQVSNSPTAGCVGQKQEQVNINQRVGCFKDEPDRRDLPHQITSAAALGSVENCVNACAAEYFM